MSDRPDNHHPLAEMRAIETSPRSSPLSLSDRVRSLRLPDRPTRRASGSSWLPWLLCLLLGGAAGYLGYERYLADSPTTVQGASSESGPGTMLRAGEQAPGSAELHAGGVA